MQDRIGPNRVGPLRPACSLADGLKFLLKEEVIPHHVDKLLFLLAPCHRRCIAAPSLVPFAVVPFGPDRADPRGRPRELQLNESYQFVIAPNVDIGILFVFAVRSLAVYGIILGGWSSNNKYSFSAALRSMPRSSATRSRWACRSSASCCSPAR